MGDRIRKRISLASAIGRWVAGPLLVSLLVTAAQSLFPTPALAQLPELAITPSIGTPGTTVTIMGSFFKPLSMISITIDGVPWATVNVTRGGSFSVKAVVPKLAPGEKRVMADGPFTTFVVLEPPAPVVPNIAVTPSFGLPGTNFTVRGTGFPQSSSVSVTIDGNAVVSGVMTTYDGSFVASAVVPSLPAGQKRITAVSGRVSASAVFEVRQPVLVAKPDLTISSTSYRFDDDASILVMSVGISNRGDARSPGTQVEIREEGSGLSLGSSTVRSLEPGATQTNDIRIKISGSRAGTTYTVRAIVDPQGFVPELSEENNWQSIVIAIPQPPRGIDWYWILVIGLAVLGLAIGIRRWSKKTVEIQVRAGVNTDRTGVQQIETDSLRLPI